MDNLSRNAEDLSGKRGKDDVLKAGKNKKEDSKSKKSSSKHSLTTDG